MVDGWFLGQNARETGRTDVFVSKRALRIYVPKSGLTVVATYPWRQVAMYCTKTGNLCKTNLKDFRNPYLRSMALFDGSSLSDFEATEKGDIQKLGLQCKELVEPRGFAKHQIAKYKQGQTGARTPSTFQYIVTRSLPADPQIGLILSRFFALPLTNAVPLQFIYTNVKGEPEKNLQISIVKETKYKSSDFKIPTGLKEVKEEITVLVPDTSDGALDLMMMGRSKVK